MLFPGLNIFWKFQWVYKSNSDVALEHPSLFSVPCSIFCLLLHLVHHPPPPPPHVPSFQMHQSASQFPEHILFLQFWKSCSFILWLTPTSPSKVSFNIPSRRPSLTSLLISLPAPLPLSHYGQTSTMPVGPYTAYPSCYHYHRTIGLQVCSPPFCKLYEGRNPPWDLYPSICTMTST